MKDAKVFGSPPPESICVDVGNLQMPPMQEVAQKFGNLEMAYNYPGNYDWPLRARVRQAMYDHHKKLNAGQGIRVRLGPGEILYAASNGWEVRER